jgi:hypothetical protein
MQSAQGVKERESANLASSLISQPYELIIGGKAGNHTGTTSSRNQPTPSKKIRTGIGHKPLFPISLH